MTKQTWMIASALSIVVVIAILVLSLKQQENRLTATQAKLAELKQLCEKTQAQAEQFRGEIEQSNAKIEKLEREKETVTKAQKGLEQEMRAALESKDITISQLQGKLTVNILDHILFDSGEAVLKPEGETVLEKIAGILEQYPSRQIHVIGHTDNVPIRASAKNRFPSNWELSTARATAAVRFLQEHAGVDPRRLGALGCGEFHPVADNNTAEGRAKNRRIALVVLPELLSAPEVISATNAPMGAREEKLSARAGTSQDASKVRESAEKPKPEE